MEQAKAAQFLDTGVATAAIERKDLFEPIGEECMLNRVVVIGDEAAPRHAYEVFATDREQMMHVIKANSFVWCLVDNRADSHANS